MPASRKLSIAIGTLAVAVLAVSSVLLYGALADTRSEVAALREEIAAQGARTSPDAERLVEALDGLVTTLHDRDQAASFHEQQIEAWACAEMVRTILGIEVDIADFEPGQVDIDISRFAAELRDRCLEVAVPRDTARR
ncbi:MAG: hypothetical protein WEE36_08700 [Acidimicrobiia bacterium]